VTSVPATVDGVIIWFGRRPAPVLPGCSHHRATKVAKAFSEDGEAFTCGRCGTWGSLVVHTLAWVQHDDRKAARIAKTAGYVAASVLAVGVRRYQYSEIVSIQVECLRCGAMVMFVNGDCVLAWEEPGAEFREEIRLATN
jgi:hypothetical protein